MANTIAIGSKVCRYQRWQIRKPALQSRGGERSLKARRPCFVPPDHIAPTAFSDMTHSCGPNSVRTDTAVIEHRLKCHFSGLLFPKLAKNRHSSTTPNVLSAILGRNPGWRTVFAVFIREHGEDSRTADGFCALRPETWGGSRMADDFCNLRPETWVETTDGKQFLRSSSGNTGRIPGQAIHLGSISGKKRPRCIEKRCKMSILSTAYP